MASELFNAVGGYSVGIPAVAVIDANGNVVTNVLTTGNVFAAYIYSDNFRYANGSPLSVNAAGANNQVQFNNDGAFGASTNFTFNSSSNLLTTANLTVTQKTNLGQIGNVTILGGNNGWFLQTDGNGVLSWAAGGGGGGNGNPGGANSQIQYNDNGSFGANPQFTFNEVTNTLNVPNINATTVVANLTGIASNANVAVTVSQANQPNITSLGTLSNLSVTGTVIAGQFQGNGIGLTYIPAANLVGSVPLADYVTQGDQSNITNVGSLLGLTVLGNIAASGNTTAGNVNVSGALTGSNLIISANANISGNLRVLGSGTLRVTGNANLAGSPNINLGTLSNIHIDGGVNGYVLTTDGTGNLTWSAGGNGGGGNGTPGGANTQIQYNDSGDFGGSPYLTFNELTNTLNVAGNLIANTIEIGSGVFKFCKSSVHFATTASAANTALYSLEANSVSSVDFTIIATDSIAGNRQVSKLSAVLYQSTLHYNEYSTLNVNGYVGNFTVGYDPGNIITPATATLYVEPTNINLSTYKILITRYEP